MTDERHTLDAIVATDDLADEPGEPREPGDDEIRALLTRLARPHRSGGKVVERASLLSAGADFAAAVAWIESHGGQAETAAAPSAPRGLHSARTSSDRGATPVRFILPATALG